MNSLQDIHCAGLSDLYAFDTKFPIPQNYENDDEVVSDDLKNTTKERSSSSHQSSSIQNQNSLQQVHPQTMESVKQSQNSMSSQTDSQTFTYGKQNQQMKQNSYLFTLKDSLTPDVRSKHKT
ncbi:hypothetical protein pb186bvf_001525 [Paramecium bursaria]